MSYLAIYLFGGFRVDLGGNPLTAFGTDKNRALLAYLALESGRPHRREALAALLWPDHSETEARNSLRQALYQLRQILPRLAEIETHLLVTGGQVQFNPSSDHWIDAAEFNARLSTCRTHHPAGMELCAGCLESLQLAVQLYQGELLEGFTLPNCNHFSEWQIITQETCRRQALAALTLLSDYFEAKQAYEQLIDCTQRKIELEPWRESAYRRQMWALAMSGKRAQALQQYENLRGILRRELGILPLEVTRQLYERILTGRLPGQQPPAHRLWRAFTSQDQTTRKAAIPFFGRQPELAQLRRYLDDSLAGRGRVAFLSGEAGSGKTALLYEFAQQATKTHGELRVAGGSCSACYGLGDSYQPFREVLERLVGITSSAHSRVPDPLFWEQMDLFNQVTRLLLALSRRFPLLILLDDLQWADRASASLLFHLGGRLAGTRILLIGAYRPEDIACAADGGRHPLAAILNEFQRRTGELQVDLSHADGHAFLNAYLDCQPNLFDQDFRETLYRHTAGNPLFTIELLEGMQTRGDVVQDKNGCWVQRPDVDWGWLPARVEAVLAERFGRLVGDCLTLLKAASVQGEVFNAGVLAQALDVTEGEITTHLSGSLCKQYRLVESLGLVKQNGTCQAQYRFRNLLFQKYLYLGLDEVERARLGRATGKATAVGV